MPSASAAPRSAASNAAGVNTGSAAEANPLRSRVTTAATLAAPAASCRTPRAEAPAPPARLDRCEDRQRLLEVGLARHQHVEQYVRVDQHPHACLRSRC